MMFMDQDTRFLLPYTSSVPLTRDFMQKGAQCQAVCVNTSIRGKYQDQ